jgi:hypothetical protein
MRRSGLGAGHVGEQSCQARIVKVGCPSRPAELPGERTRKGDLDRTCPAKEMAAIGSRDTSGQGPWRFGVNGWPLPPTRPRSIYMGLKLTGHYRGVSARRMVLMATAGVVTTVAVLLVLLRWDSANKIAVVVSALATVAAVGVAVWAALPAVSGMGVQVSRTGRATAGTGGRANSGVFGPAGSLLNDVLVDRTGDADASNGGDANTGIQLNLPLACPCCEEGPGG